MSEFLFLITVFNEDVFTTSPKYVSFHNNSQGSTDFIPTLRMRKLMYILLINFPTAPQMIVIGLKIQEIPEPISLRTKNNSRH